MIALISDWHFWIGLSLGIIGMTIFAMWAFKP